MHALNVLASPNVTFIASPKCAGCCGSYCRLFGIRRKPNSFVPPTTAKLEDGSFCGSAPGAGMGDGSVSEEDAPSASHCSSWAWTPERDMAEASRVVHEGQAFERLCLLMSNVANSSVENNQYSDSACSASRALHVNPNPMIARNRRGEQNIYFNPCSARAGCQEVLRNLACFERLSGRFEADLSCLPYMRVPIDWFRVWCLCTIGDCWLAICSRVHSYPHHLSLR